MADNASELHRANKLQQDRTTEAREKGLADQNVTRPAPIEVARDDQAASGPADRSAGTSNLPPDSRRPDPAS